MTRTAKEVAHWIIKKNQLTDSWADKACLHKLLFFTWLIYFAKHKEPLFNEDFLAFKNGPVTDTIPYLTDQTLSEIRDMDDVQFEQPEVEILELSHELFGDADCNELIQLSHASPAWGKHYNASKCIILDEVFYDAHIRIIPPSELKAEIRMIRNMLRAYDSQCATGC